MNRSSSLVRRNTTHVDRAEEDVVSSSLKTPLREGRSDEGTSQPTMAGKRKKPEYQPGRFKAVSQLVMAMNRFKGQPQVSSSIPVFKGVATLRRSRSLIADKTVSEGSTSVLPTWRTNESIAQC